MYRQLARLYHPDKCRTLPPEEAHRAFLDINRAFSLMTEAFEKEEMSNLDYNDEDEDEDGDYDDDEDDEGDYDDGYGDEEEEEGGYCEEHSHSHSHHAHSHNFAHHGHSHSHGHSHDNRGRRPHHTYGFDFMQVLLILS
jgi:DnaJ-class molecular chaperone